MKLGLIGCGVIGERRASALPEGTKIIACFDPNQERAQKISSITGCEIVKSAEEIAGNPQIQGVIIAGINSILVPTMKLLAAKKIPVIVEKPAARSYKELASLNPAKDQIIKVGFNHRFHPAFFDLQKELAKHKDDPIMFIRAQYGNGARLGFDQEWRSKVELSGGGELLDQGVHLLDLASCLIPNLSVQTSYVRTQYWNMPVDDNAWAILSSPEGQTFTMHVSSSEWKNEFRFEVYTRQRKYQWLGLGRSYGPEKLFIHTMKPEMGPPVSEERSYAPEDHSWLLENTNFVDAINNKANLNGSYTDALHCLKLVEKIYELSFQVQNNPQTKTHTKEHPQWWKN